MIVTSPGRSVGVSAVGGVVAALIMAVFAMLAAWQKGTGFFTPLYHIAALLEPHATMTASMRDAMAGDAFHFVLGTAAVGAIIHMMTGAMYGAIFGAFASRLDFDLRGLAAIGLVYGLAVFLASTFAGLPTAAAIFNAGEPIRNMPALSGWGTFLVEHLLFGAALGAFVALIRTRTTALPRWRT